MKLEKLSEIKLVGDLFDDIICIPNGAILEERVWDNDRYYCISFYNFITGERQVISKNSTGYSEIKIIKKLNALLSRYSTNDLHTIQLFELPNFKWSKTHYLPKCDDIFVNENGMILTVKYRQYYTAYLYDIIHNKHKYLKKVSQYLNQHDCQIRETIFSKNDKYLVLDVGNSSLSSISKDILVADLKSNKIYSLKEIIFPFVGDLSLLDVSDNSIIFTVYNNKKMVFCLGHLDNLSRPIVLATIDGITSVKPFNDNDKYFTCLCSNGNEYGFIVVDRAKEEIVIGYSNISKIMVSPVIEHFVQLNDGTILFTDTRNFLYRVDLNDRKLSVVTQFEEKVDKLYLEPNNNYLIVRNIKNNKLTVYKIK